MRPRVLFLSGREVDYMRNRVLLDLGVVAVTLVLVALARRVLVLRLPTKPMSVERSK